MPRTYTNTQIDMTADALERNANMSCGSDHGHYDSQIAGMIRQLRRTNDLLHVTNAALRTENERLKKALAVATDELWGGEGDIGHWRGCKKRIDAIMGEGYSDTLISQQKGGTDADVT